MTSTSAMCRAASIAVIGIPSGKRNPTAARLAYGDFCGCATQALGVWEAAQDRGLRVPEELSVIGYNDIEISEYIGLTTMRQMLYESGKRGVEWWLEVLENSSLPPQCEVLPTTLIIRKRQLRRMAKRRWA